MSKKTALITGAGSGIGRATAQKLANHGINLILIGRNLNKLEETKKLCDKVDIKCFSVDISHKEEIKTLFDHNLQFDYLINNAGVTMNKRFEEVTEEEYDQIMSINAKGPFFMCQSSLPILHKSESATIINIGSVVAYKGYMDQSVYASSKHALAGMTKALAKEVSNDGIRVHLINPGGVLTDMVRQARPDLPPDANDMIAPEDIADIIYFILSHRSNAIIDEINVHRRTKEPFL